MAASCCTCPHKEFSHLMGPAKLESKAQNPSRDRINLFVELRCFAAVCPQSFMAFSASPELPHNLLL